MKEGERQVQDDVTQHAAAHGSDDAHDQRPGCAHAERQRLGGGDRAEPVMAVTVIRHGGDGLSAQELGDIARAQVPEGAASPLALMIEHSAGEPGGSVLDIDGVVPRGDLRDHAREIVRITPLEILYAAWCATTEMRRWAEDLCGAVEAELDTGRPAVGKPRRPAGVHPAGGRLLTTRTKQGRDGWLRRFVDLSGVSGPVVHALPGSGPAGVHAVCHCGHRGAAALLE
ncbi:hypothetical protein [Actinocrispum sp. NPDC049592]|uniref:hypothetical protein n=1 Tax=Actinocrispum sp. NPDC049592 TaxID=3154835 RepID=UPI003434AC64